MNYREQYTPVPVSDVQLCLLWSPHVDALERHLSANRWALSVVTVVLIAYAIARIVIPTMLNDIIPHGIVPDLIRTVLKLM